MSVESGQPPLGAGPARLQHLRAAQALLEGDLLEPGRDIDLTGDQGTAPLRRLSPNFYDEVRYAFVDPAGWDKLLSDFGRQRAVILRGAVGHGRLATSVRLLQAVGVEKVYQLDERVDLDRLGAAIRRDADAGVVGPHAGYLMCRSHLAEPLQARTVNQLEAALEDVSSWLVITVDDGGTKLGDEALLRYVVDLPSPPEQKAIFTEHLRWRLGRATAETVLGSPAVSELVDEVLAGPVSPGRAAALALALAPGPDGSVDVERVRRRMQRRIDDEFEIWFESLTDLDNRTFAIALAALNGLSFDAIDTAAVQLRIAVERSARQAYEGTGRPAGIERSPMDLFEVRSSRMLNLLRARQLLVDGATGPFAGIPTETVQYKDPEYTSKVIERAWQSGGLRGALLSWLEGLVDEGPEVTRIFAGTTLGLLTKHSFEQLLRLVLTPWATGDRAQHRDAVAYALRVLAADRDLRRLVERLAYEWHTDTESPLAQATAARVYGVSLGDLEPTWALRHLRGLAMVANAEVQTAIADSMADLLHAHAAELSPRILEDVLRWLDDRTRAATGFSVFLSLADALTVEPPAAGSGTVRWPTLLFLAQQQPALRTPLANLWHRALNDASCYRRAEQVLTRWAGFAENHAGVRDTFARLARTTAQFNDRTSRILRRLAYLWDSDESLQPLPHTAMIVIASLDRGAALDLGKETA
ncbi:hypothetical protein [Micromonospora chalcea]|uniref:hypothetical protein n=1 Tax=Micromonospora chalcea TaxID=1874 RepID=UPI0038081541